MNTGNHNLLTNYSKISPWQASGLHQHPNFLPFKSFTFYKNPT